MSSIFPDAAPDTRDNVDLLHQLPNELLLEIIKKCTDFTTLWSLINTSPRLSSIFDTRALEIVEPLLSTAMPTQIRFLIRAVLSIRTRKFECQSWAQMMNCSLSKPQPLDLAVSPALLRKLVGLAHRIHLLAHACIEGCLERCTSISSPKNLEPPSWIEEHRAVLAFWEIQFFFELKVGRLKGRLEWSSEDLGRLQFVTIDQFKFYSGFVRALVLTAFDFIEELRTTSDPQQGSESPNSVGGSSISAPSSWTCSTCFFQLPTLPAGESEFNYTCQTHELLPSHGQNWRAQQWQDLDSETQTWRFFMQRTTDRKAGLLKFAQFDPYRKYGFALWGEKRMADLGFLSPLGLTDAEDYWDRWCSVLSEKDVERILRNKEEYWRR